MLIDTPQVPLLSPHPYPDLADVLAAHTRYCHTERIMEVTWALIKLRPRANGTLPWLTENTLGRSCWENPLREMADDDLIFRHVDQRIGRRGLWVYTNWYRIEPRGELFLALEDEGEFPAPPPPPPDPRQLKLPFGSAH